MARILVVIVLVQTAVFSARPLVTYRTLLLGGDAADIGLAAGALGLAAVVVAVPAGRWVDRLGEVPFIVAGCAVSALALVATLRAGSVPALVGAQMVLGAGHIVAVVAVQAWIANRAPDGRRERDFAALTIAVSIAAVIGPALLGVLTSGTASTPTPAELTQLLAVTVGAALLAALVAATLPWRRAAPGGGPPTGEPLTVVLWILRILRTPAVAPAVVVSVAGVTVLDLVAVYLPLFGERVGLSVTQVSVLLTVRALASVLSRLGVVVLVERLGRLTVLVTTMAVPAALLAVLPLVDRFVGLLVLMAMVGAALALSAPLTLAVVAGEVPGRARGAALGVRMSAIRLSQGVMPIAVGALTATLGVATAFVAMAAVLAVGTAAAVRAVPPPRAPAPEDSGGQDSG